MYMIFHDNFGYSDGGPIYCTKGTDTGRGGGGKKLKMVARDLAITFQMLSAKYWQETLIPLQTINSVTN